MYVYKKQIYIGVSVVSVQSFSAHCVQCKLNMLHIFKKNNQAPKEEVSYMCTYTLVRLNHI